MARSGEVLQRLALGRSTVGRDGLRRSDPGLIDLLLADPATAVLELRGERAAVAGDRDRPVLALRPPLPTDRGRLALYLGREDATAFVAVLHDDTGKTDGYAGLRAVGALLADRDAGLLTTATGVLNWHATHTHCPRCGTPTEPSSGGWTRVCPRDQSEHYPRTDPAVIMSVVDDDDRLLLARGRMWEGTSRYSVLAGFVEPGETLPDAVVREVMEEVGVEVDEVRYLGDQPWPFPASLMLGFTAHARTTALNLQEDEIVTARWFSREELTEEIAAGRVAVPNRLSIARRIVEHWYGREFDGGDWF